MREIEVFKMKYKNVMERKGLRVEYFGSTKDSAKWKKGKSDLDIFVYGDNIPLEVKVEGVLLVRDLNYELELELQNVPFQHWTPIYIDSQGRLMLKEISEEEIIRRFTESVRSVIKELSKVWWPITYQKWWDCVERAYENRLRPLPLPPPCPPIPPIVFLKIL
ncbi:hypothetical protein DRN48_09345 [Thermococci archaeon]|nr:MAG: hypothetical protein DRN48_09345 [Thermococci archaeon]